MPHAQGLVNPAKVVVRKPQITGSFFLKMLEDQRAVEA
jgi:hypothetical protein